MRDDSDGARSLLVDLADSVPRAWEERDAWCLLTAVALGPSAWADARLSVEDVLELVDWDPTWRVVDLGSGTGRHAGSLSRTFDRVTAIESSRILAELSRDVAPTVDVREGSFHDVGGFGEFDLALSFNDSVMIASSLDAFHGNLQFVRGALRDFGVLILEVGGDTAGERTMHGPHDLVITESVTTDGTVSRHDFRFSLGGDRWSRSMCGVTPDLEQLRSVAQEAGFQVERWRTTRDGTRLYLLRAVRGYNFVSDLPELLDSWADPAHPRNSREVSLGTDPSGRRKPDGEVQEGTGVSLSRHHPDFVSAIEPRIRPLVLELVDNWNFVSYSSCEGHRVDRGAASFSEAYCGIIVFSNEQTTTLTQLLDEFARARPDLSLHPRLRVRTLFGTGCSFVAADLLFERNEVPQRWAEYRGAVDESVNAMVDFLVRSRTGN